MPRGRRCPRAAFWPKGIDMRLRFAVPALFAAAALTGLWLTRPAPADDPTTPHLGEKIAHPAFTGPAGTPPRLYDLKEKKAIVLVFLSFDCPVSTSYAQPLADMANELGKHGVAFVGLSTNQDETAADLARHAKECTLPFPVLQDKKFAAADALAAEVTPEGVVLD